MEQGEVAALLVLRRQTRLLTVVTAEQAQAVKAVEAVVQVVGLQEQVALEEQVVNPQVAAAVVVQQPTDQLLEPVAQVVLV